MDNSPRGQFKAIQILHLSLMSGPAMIFLVLWFQMPPEINMKPLEGSFGLILPFVVLGAVVLGKLLAKNLKSTLKKSDLEGKIVNYRTSSIMRWALIEGASLMSLMIFFFIENSIMSLMSFAFALFALALLRPTVEGFSAEYELSNREQQELN